MCILAIAVSIVFFLMNLWSVAAYFYVGIVVLFISLYLLSEKEQFLFITFLIPNLFMFKYIGSASAILGYFFMFAFFLQLFTKPKMFEFDLCLMLHFFACCATAALYNDFSLFVSSFRFVVNFYLFLTLGLLLKKEEIGLFLKTYIVGALFAIAFAIIYRSSLGTLYNGLFAGINSGRNFFAAVISPIFCILILLFMEKGLSLKKVIFYCVALTLCFISVFLSGSRTAIIAMLFPVLLLVFYIPLNQISLGNICKYSVFIFLLVLIFLYMSTYYSDSIDFLFNRFTEDNLQTGNNRFNLWKHYYDHALANNFVFIFGSGMSYEENVLAEHNFFIQGLFQTGLIGIITYIFLFIRSYKVFVNKTNQINLKSFFPLMVVLFSYSGISSFHSDQMSFLMILSLLTIRYFSNNKLY